LHPHQCVHFHSKCLFKAQSHHARKIGPAIEEAAMLSRAQQARVLDVLRDCPSDAISTYCLEHLAAAVKIPPIHAADLITFLQVLRG